jgi:transcriptional regulator with XRE-family HTH domain
MTARSVGVRPPRSADLHTSAIVADRIAYARRQRGWNRDQLAKECAAAGAPDITAPAITNIETGRRVDGRRRRAVTIDELVVFAQLFGVALDWFLSAPTCPACEGCPPAGYTCNQCQSTTP